MRGDVTGGQGKQATRRWRGASALATELLWGEGEEDDTGRWRWWAGPGLSHSAGPGGLRGERQVSLLLLFNFFVLFYFYLIFCHCFEFKIIQTMPKAPLNIFILLYGLFHKLIKDFRGI